MSMKLNEIASILQGEIEGDGNVEILHLAKIGEAGPGDITFLSNPKYRKHLTTTSATAILVNKNEMFPELSGHKTTISLIKVKDPYISFLRLIEYFYPPATPLEKGIHSTAVIATSASLGENVAIGPFVTIGERCKIGANVSIYPGTAIGNDIEIGQKSLLYANVTIRENCKLGQQVIIHSGTVIGSDGFGFAPKEDGTYEKIPQRGTVVIEDDVEIGSNCTIDRATIGETRIKRGAKLDNLIQIAHNVIVGENTVIAAQTGISGSTKIGKNCAFGGQVGITGHIQIADRTSIGAKSGVPKSITESGKTYFGYPATEIRHSMRIEASVRQLPEMIAEIAELKKRIEILEQTLHQKISETK
jgi:UDP-3-O-[3-hydroxymyristoyl] glucosamine N-acyltransferase